MSTHLLAPGDARGQGRADVGLSVFVLAVQVVIAWSTWDADRDLSLGALVGLAVLCWLPLIARHRWPVAVLAVVLVLECTWLALVPLEPPLQFTSAPVVVMLAAWEVGLRHDWKLAWGAAAVAAQTVLVVGEVTRGDVVLAANVYALDLVLVAAGAGVVVRSRHRRLVALEGRAVAAEQDREAEARRQVAAERFRMARELHDVLAHHLTLVNAQAGVAAYLVRTDAEAAAQALDGITDHTRQALDELRATVGLLRQYDAEPAAEPAAGGPVVGSDARLGPVPSLEDLARLLDAHRRSGTDVDLDVVGEPHVMSSVSGLAAYRIVQESLTNARKHAPGAQVRISLGWGSSALALAVDNAAPPTAPLAPGPGTGHGMIGMRERAEAVGGRLDVTARADGGFRVAADIPFETEP